MNIALPSSGLLSPAFMPASRHQTIQPAVPDTVLFEGIRDAKNPYPPSEALLKHLREIHRAFEPHMVHEINGRNVAKALNIYIDMMQTFATAAAKHLADGESLNGDSYILLVCRDEEQLKQLKHFYDVAKRVLKPERWDLKAGAMHLMLKTSIRGADLSKMELREAGEMKHEGNPALLLHLELKGFNKKDGEMMLRSMDTIKSMVKYLP